MDAVEPRIRELLQAYPDDAGDGDRRADRLDRGADGAQGAGAELRPAYLPPDPASRTSYEAGEIAQCDLWFPDVELPVGYGQVRTATQLPVLAMVSGYSRWLAAGADPVPAGGGSVRRLVAADRQLGAVPRVLVWDGEAAVGRGAAASRADRATARRFRGTLGAR